jgi:RNA-directed DNA polymerase
VIGEDDRGVTRTVGGGKANRCGTPQGGVISPLLANCYLHILDRIWQRRHLQGNLQARLVRYADDFVVMCRRDVAEPFEWIQDSRLDPAL